MPGGDHDTKAVLDTNVWLDWALFEDPSLEPLRAVADAGRLRVVATRRMRDELADVLTRPAVLAQAGAARARRGLPAPDGTLALAEFDARATIVEPGGPCGLVCRDPDDQIFIDLAVAQRARWLLSKDRALLRLASRARKMHGLLIAPADRSLGVTL